MFDFLSSEILMFLLQNFRDYAQNFLIFLGAFCMTFLILMFHLKGPEVNFSPESVASLGRR